MHLAQPMPTLSPTAGDRSAQRREGASPCEIKLLHAFSRLTLVGIADMVAPT
jgi:hypothetical protein